MPASTTAQLSWKRNCAAAKMLSSWAEATRRDRLRSFWRRLQAGYTCSCGPQAWRRPCLVILSVGSKRIPESYSEVKVKFFHSKAPSISTAFAGAMRPAKNAKWDQFIDDRFIKEL